MKFVKSLLLLTLPLLLTNCEEVTPIDKLDPYTEKLVVNEYFSNTGPFSIQISGSKHAYKEASPSVLDSSQLSVILTENDVPLKLSYDQFSDVFYTNSNPIPGKIYNLFVKSAEYPEVSATGQLPSNVLGKSAVCIFDGGKDMQGNVSDLLKLTFNDDGGSKDYYKVNFLYYNETKEEFTAFEFELNDVLTAVNTIKSRDGGYLFSDESFSGQQKVITAVPPMGLVSSNQTYKYLIKIERLSEAYWKYSTTLEQSRGGLNGGVSSTNLFRGAVLVYSNVTNGLGIFAGSNVQSDTIK